MFDRAAPLFARDFMWLKLLATVYVVGILVTHSTLPHAYVWGLAAFFSVAMNFTYPWAALKTGDFFRTEVVWSGALIAMALVGLWVSPLLVILSIFGHGVWDLMKHRGHGVGFFNWYTLGCVTVDWLYAGALFIFWSVL